MNHWMRRGAGLGLLCAMVGCSDAPFEQRQVSLLKEKLHRAEEQFEMSRNGLAQLHATQVIAEMSTALLVYPLSDADYADVLGTQATALLTLAINGDDGAADQLLKVCNANQSSRDPRVREACDLAMCRMEFAQQADRLRRLRLPIDIAELARHPESGENGARLAELSDEVRKQIALPSSTAGRRDAIDQLLDDMRPLANSFPITVGEPREMEERFNQLVAAHQVGDLDVASDLDGALARARELAATYPASAALIQSLIAFFDRLALQGNHDESAQVAQLMFDLYRDSTAAEIRDQWPSIANRQTLAQFRIKRWNTSVLRAPDRIEQTLEAIKAAVQEIRAAELWNPVIENHVVAAARKIEQVQQFDAVRDLASFFETQFAESPGEGEQARRFAALAARRMALRQTAFPRPDPQSVETFGKEGAADRATVVLFWSPESVESLTMIDRLNVQVARENVDAIGVLGVHVGKNLERARGTIRSSPPLWPVIIARALDAEGRNPLAEMYAVEETPYLMVVDASGNIAEVALTLQQAMAHARRLQAPDTEEDAPAAPRARRPAVGR